MGVIIIYVKEAQAIFTFLKMTKLKLIIGCILIVTACQNKDEVATLPDTDKDCLITGSSGAAIEGQFIISMPSEKSGAGRLQLVAKILNTNRISSDAIIESFEGESAYYLMQLNAEEAQKLKNDNTIKSIEPDRVISACGCFTVKTPESITWNVNKVGYGDGREKTAWIIDSGIDSDHPDLNVDKLRSRSFVENQTSFEDDNGHGTHIAGIIGALNNDFGTLGVASGASLVALKVLDNNGDGKLSGLLKALTYVNANAKAGEVVNISIGFTDISVTLEREINAIAGKGIYFTLAAGNESTNANTYSPARISGKNIYTVTAVDSLNRFASFSNFGNDVVDFAAPGVKVLSTYSEGRYAILSGTSMASPHVAGLLLINDGKVNSTGFAVGDPDGTPDPLAHQ